MATAILSPAIQVGRDVTALYFRHARTPERRDVLTLLGSASGGRHETLTDVALRALASEVARCQADAGCVADLEVLKLFAGEDLGLSPQQLQSLGMGPGLPEVKRVKRRRGSIGAKRRK